MGVRKKERALPAVLRTHVDGLSAVRSTASVAQLPARRCNIRAGANVEADGSDFTIRVAIG